MNQISGTQTRLERFASLRWYSSSVTFLFSFLAITSEPLLAAGIVLSAIDFLQRGQLLSHNPGLAAAWSIAQGLAMEVSVGPVLVNTLLARKEHDPVKMRLYGVLGVFLFAVGGAMLFLQFTESIMNVQEAQLHPAVLITLFAARTIASLGYIALACTKRVRFSGSVQLDHPTNNPHADAVQMLLERVEQLTVTITQITATATQTVSQAHSEPLELPERTEVFALSEQSEHGEQSANTEQLIRIALLSNPGLTDRQIAEIVRIAPSTANKYRKRIEQGEQA